MQNKRFPAQGVVFQVSIRYILGNGTDLTGCRLGLWASFLYGPITKEETWLAKFERPRFCSARMLAGF